MAARTRFYVYEMLDGDVVAYVGKGSGHRLEVQRRHFGLPGRVAAEFSSEARAYAFERELISRLKPVLNRHPGGNGSRARRHREPRWCREMERLGTRKYAALALLRFDTRGYLSDADRDKLRTVVASTG